MLDTAAAAFPFSAKRRWILADARDGEVAGCRRLLGTGTAPTGRQAFKSGMRGSSTLPVSVR
jgi:hypothetical protein